MAVYLLINSLHGGGAEKLAIESDLFNNYSRIFLLDSDIQYSLKDDFVKRLNIYNVKSYNIFKILYVSFKISKFLKNDDIIIGVLYKSIIVAILAKILFKKKIKIYSWILSDSIYHSKKTLFHYIIIKFINTFSDRLIVNSLSAKEQHIKFLNVPFLKLEVIYNSFDFNLLYNKSLEEVPHDDISLINSFKIKMIYVARLHPFKGHMELLEILKFVNLKETNTGIFFFGYGPLLNEINNFVTENNLGKNIFTMGFKPNIYKYYPLMDFLLFPSFTEGFGNVLIEALFFKCFIISADIDNGPREILSPQSEILFRTTTPEVLEYGILLPSLNTKVDVKNVWIEIINKELLNFNNLRKLIKTKDLSLFDSVTISKHWMNLLNNKKTE